MSVTLMHYTTETLNTKENPVVTPITSRKPVLPQSQNTNIEHNQRHSGHCWTFSSEFFDP